MRETREAIDNAAVSGPGKLEGDTASEGSGKGSILLHRANHSVTARKCRSS